MTLPFDPQAHAALAGMAGQLRALAGDAAYQAGRDYLRKGQVKQGTVAGAVAYATVTGSTDYRVSVAFPDELKVSCTCPAHRRNKYCKHVVAVCVSLLERPGDFTVSDALPEVAPPAKPKRQRGEGGTEKPEGGRRTKQAAQAAQRAAGLETVDQLLTELAGNGQLTLGPDKAELLAAAAELVRALKLRRLGNLVMTLQQAATPKGRQQLEPDRFARLVMDLWLTRRVTGAHLDGSITLDPLLAEDLIGKTWREEELEPVSGLRLMELAFTRSDDREFRVETSYLADVGTGAIYAEKTITPVRLWRQPRPRHRQLLVADEARLYPGSAPRRVRLTRTREEPLTAGAVAGLLPHATDSVAELRRRLVERLQTPFGQLEVAALFRPAALLRDGEQLGAADATGAFLALDCPKGWANELPGLLPEAGGYALFGLLDLTRAGMVLQCLAVVSPELRWGRGPVYPE